MKSNISNEAAGFIRKHKNYRRYVAVFVCLALVVAVETMLGLRLYGQAMSRQIRVFDCPVQVHEHTEECYAEVNGEKVLNCGEADFVVHSHDLSCFDDDGLLVCQLPENEAHRHTSECSLVTRELICGREEIPAHTHDASCVGETRELVCGLEDSAPHTHDSSCCIAREILACDQTEHVHTDGCYAGSEVLTCSEDEHTHADSCYDENGELCCGLGQHVHGDACYAVETSLTCGETEHEHSDSCYTTREVLACGLEESEGHTHTDDCWEIAESFICGLESTEGHSHTDDCYREEKILLCEKPEVVLHTHSEGCYTPLEELEEQAEGELRPLGLDLSAVRTVEVTDEETGETVTLALTCGETEVLEHVHTEEAGCFHTEIAEDPDDTDSPGPSAGIDGPDGSDGPDATPAPEPELVCGRDEHTHSEDCYTYEKLNVCGLEQGESHTHTDACWFTEKVLGCGAEEHSHSDGCWYVPEPAPEPGVPVDGSCYDAYGELVCGREEHTHSEDCYTVTQAAACGLEEDESHTHTDGCWEERSLVVCGLQEHTHILPEGMEPPAEPVTVTVSREAGDLLVTAAYDSTAIPEDAEFRVERIDPEGEHAGRYARRMDAAREAIRNESGDDVKVTPVALLNIGFYLEDGSEIVPGGPVSISVRFLGEDSPVAEGDSVSVVHFGDDATDVLPGTDVDSDCATSFETASFSDFAVAIANDTPDDTGGESGGSKAAATEFDHNKYIDYLGDGGNNPDTDADSETVTDDLYRLYLDMTGKSEPIDLLIVIDRSNSMGDSMGSKTRWQTVYDILEGTNNKGTDGLLYQFLKANEGKTDDKDKNFVSIVWFAGVFKSRDSSVYGNKSPDIAPNSEYEGGTVLDWTSSYKHQGTTNYTISPHNVTVNTTAVLNQRNQI